MANYNTCLSEYDNDVEYCLGLCSYYEYEYNHCIESLNSASSSDEYCAEYISSSESALESYNSCASEHTTTMDFAIKIVLDSETNKVTNENYVVFKKDGTIYTLRTGVDESTSESKQIYKANQDELDKVFGSEDCYKDTYYPGEYDVEPYVCNFGGSELAYVQNDGHVEVFDNTHSYYCIVDANSIGTAEYD